MQYPKRKRIKFELEAPHAQEVAVVLVKENGKEDTFALRPNQAHTWERIRLLPPGRYVYFYKVDGKTVGRFENPRVAHNAPKDHKGELQVYFPWTKEI